MRNGYGAGANAIANASLGRATGPFIPSWQSGRRPRLRTSVASMVPTWEELKAQFVGPDE